MAGGLFGIWAAFANRSHGMKSMASAAVAQAALSMASTFGLTLLLEWFLSLSRLRPVRLLLGMLGGPLFILGVMSLTHWWARTPNIFETIVPSLTTGTLFCAAYTWSWEKTRLQQAPR
jgi:hypothetical protein